MGLRGLRRWPLPGLRPGSIRGLFSQRWKRCATQRLYAALKRRSSTVVSAAVILRLESKSHEGERRGTPPFGYAQGRLSRKVREGWATRRLCWGQDQRQRRRQSQQQRQGQRTGVSVP